ncbi:MAG: hypothetical protein Kow0010_19660 [Dehalococcoidia bacterium]
MASKLELLEQIATSRSALDRLVAGLSPRDFERTDAAGWTVKDQLAHIAAWERILMAVLRGEDRGAPVGLAPGEAFSIDEINAHILERSRHQPLSEVLADYRRTHAELLSELDQLSDVDLELPYSHFQPQSAGEDWASHPIIAWIRDNTTAHYDEHAIAIRQTLSDDR